MAEFKIDRSDSARMKTTTIFSGIILRAISISGACSLQLRFSDYFWICFSGRRAWKRAPKKKKGHAGCRGTWTRAWTRGAKLRSTAGSASGLRSEAAQQRCLAGGLPQNKRVRSSLSERQSTNSWAAIMCRALITFRKDLLLFIAKDTSS